MNQLLRHTERDRRVWNTGSALFRISHEIDSWRVTVAVRCRIERLESSLALLDTGAEWSVIGGDIAAEIRDEIGQPIESSRMRTHLGSIDGSLHHVNITLLAGEEDSGDDLTVETTSFVSEEWEGPVVLGYRGFLERIRFALNPGVVPGEQIFYFGLAE